MVESVWKQNVTLPSFAALESDLKTEVLIIGGGLAGILCAWQLQQRGIPYALVEADRICQGVTGNTTAKITVQHGLIYEKLLSTIGEEKAKAYYRINQQALEAYGQLSDKIPCDFSYRKNYLYSTQDVSSLEKEWQAMNRLGIPAEFERKIGIPFPVKGAISLDRQAQFHPLKLVAGLVPGMRIYEHTKVTEWTGTRVKTEGGSIRAEKVIVATHFPMFNRHGGYFLKMHQQRSYVLALEGAEPVEGMYLDASGNGLSMRMHGDLLLLGGGGQRTGKQGGGWEYLRSQAQIWFSGAKEAAHWATQDCMTLDGIPYVGQYGKHTPQLYVVTGFNKWGMTSSMASAFVLADLMEGKKTVYSDLFSPERSILHPKLVTHMMESAVNLLSPTSPRCPHLGCALKWNAQEHSWDCPCHGSRFDSHGNLLDGPATGDLPKKEN